VEALKNMREVDEQIKISNEAISKLIDTFGADQRGFLSQSILDKLRTFVEAVSVKAAGKSEYSYDIFQTEARNYVASKAGIIGFTKSLAKEVAAYGIRVNAVAPGYIQTEMTAKLSEDARNKMLANIPMGKLGTPADVAGVCLFLASTEADYITGQTIVVDGGMAM